ncbi:MAG: acyl carrier protein [Verrucomicrobiales bacterium]|nr:acyl carrier protein [Verrucomicrobiales bacterium]
MREEIINLLQRIRPDEDFDESEDFVEDGLIDSLDVIRIVAEMEKEFGIDIDGNDILPEHFESFESLEALVSKSKS